MNSRTTTLLLIGVGCTLGILIGAFGQQALAPRPEASKPLYWVAPMDPDYRRDGPGKSPMGMDLVPVYAEDETSEAAGVVRISPEVVNNLGVRTAPVRTGKLDDRIRTVGHVGYDENQLVHMHPRVEGWIETLHVKAEGDPVASGEPLFELYSPTLVNAQEELVLALNRNNPELVNAAIERLAALAVSETTIEALRDERKANRTVTVYAPRSGVLEALAVREGMYVSPGMNVMTIGTLDHVWVVGELYERQAGLVAPGDTVNMSLDYLPGRTWTGSVAYVYPSLNEQTRTLRIRAEFDNADGALKPGMFAELAIRPARERPPTLLIPREALIRTGQQSRVVLAIGDGRFKSVEVTPGRFGLDEVEITEGLESGERIVVSAQFLIDSESSKTSDFQRMNRSSAIGDDQGEVMDHDMHDHEESRQ
jgi:Cu(I)/Ag(I) efflux system membrane fusion protein